MEKTLRVLNRLVKDDIIENYAIGGAVAAIFYIEPINTNDLDIFFLVKDENYGLDMLKPLYDYLFELGYKAENETVEIEGWPVQFLPVFNPLLEEAVEEAKDIRFKRTTTRVMSAEHLVAIMLQTGRHKDFARIHQFLEQNLLDNAQLFAILERHGLRQKWEAHFRENPL